MYLLVGRKQEVEPPLLFKKLDISNPGINVFPTLQLQIQKPTKLFEPPAVPSMLTHTHTHLYLYAGGPSAPPQQNGSLQDLGHMWVDHPQRVLHHLRHFHLPIAAQQEVVLAWPLLCCICHKVGEDAQGGALILRHTAPLPFLAPAVIAAVTGHVIVTDDVMHPKS